MGKTRYPILATIPLAKHVTRRIILSLVNWIEFHSYSSNDVHVWHHLLHEKIYGMHGQHNLVGGCFSGVEIGFGMRRSHKLCLNLRSHYIFLHDRDTVIKIQLFRVEEEEGN